VSPTFAVESGCRGWVLFLDPTWSIVVGVGSSTATSLSWSLSVCPHLEAGVLWSVTIGVGSSAHDAGKSSASVNSRGRIPWAISTACSSDGADRESTRIAADRLVRSAWTLGVGSEEDALPAVGGADVGCSNADPLRVVPDVGQVTEDDVDSSNKESWDVLHDDESGS
jgi:hypothetical protein